MTPESADLYEILQVHPTAQPEVIQTAYRRLAQIYHPDRNPAADASARMAEINRAYEVLSDPQQRAAYDRQCGDESNGTVGNGGSMSKVNIGEGVLSGWHRRQGLIQRLFAPSNFLDAAEFVEAEDFTCRRATTDFLTFSVTETVEELTVADRMNYSDDLRLLDYRPKEFNVETVRVVVNERQVRCSSCSGQGRNPCPPSVQCGDCSGAGSFPCYPEMPCPSCAGTLRVPCRSCQGTGRQSSWDTYHPGDPCTHCRGRASFRCRTCLSRTGVPIGRVICDQCMGSGRKRCERCQGAGRMVCLDCDGQGYILCDRCDASGTVVYAGMVTHTFTPKHSTQFLPQIGNAGGLKNGITADHLAALQGKVVSDEYQRPNRQDIVLQKLTVVDFDVSSYQFRYSGKHFLINHIKDANGWITEFATIKLPLSAKKVAIASGIGVLALGVAIGTAALFGYW